MTSHVSKQVTLHTHALRTHRSIAHRAQYAWRVQRSKIANIAPLVVGTTFGILLFVLSPFSSGSFNPARSLGPAAVSQESSGLWIFMVAPVLGSLAAVPLHLFMVRGAHDIPMLRRSRSCCLTHMLLLRCCISASCCCCQLAISLLQQS